MIPLWYKSLTFCALPFAVVRLRWRGRKDPNYKDRTGERWGRVPVGLNQGSIWFHAVSVGETVAIAPTISRLIESSPGTRYLVTSSTPTGSAEVTQRLGTNVDHCYLPYDFPESINRFLDATNPKALFLVETELWPVLIDATNTRDVPVYLINARLSERSAARYARFKRLTAHIFGMLRGVSCQYQATAERFAQLGVPRDR